MTQWWSCGPIGVSVGASMAQTVEVDPKALGPQPILAANARLEPGWDADLDVLDAPARLAEEVVVEVGIAVEAGRRSRDRNLAHGPLRDEHLEVAIDRPEREAGELREQRVVDPGGGRVVVALLHDLEDALSLSGAVPPERLGG